MIFIFRTQKNFEEIKKVKNRSESFQVLYASVFKSDKKACEKNFQFSNFSKRAHLIKKLKFRILNP